MKKNVVLNQAVPAFKLPSTSGETFDLAKKKGKFLVLYFYPRDLTPGCTVQGHEFTKNLKKFTAAGAEVYGISRDSIKSHEKFIDKECLNFELLSDEEEKACKLFDVIKQKNMYGKKVMGIERSTFLVDKKGKLVFEWRKVKPQNHALEVLSKIQELN